MVEDERCCGTGTCLIDAQGRCWCGQQWDGQTMCRPGSMEAVDTKTTSEAADEASDPTASDLA